MTDERSRRSNSGGRVEGRPAAVDPVTDDPYAHLTPSERFANAIKRREILVQRQELESRLAVGSGRRATDTERKKG
jgi:hypothetical protein